MTNRRQFLTVSIATSALLTSLPVDAAALLANSSTMALGDFVFDNRFLPASQMAENIGQRSTRTYPISGDVAELWYDELAPAIAKGPRIIGGLTTLGELFVMARLGHDAGLTLAMHGSHQLTTDELPISHTLSAPALNQRRFMTALASGTPWTSAVQSELLALASRSVTDWFEIPDMKSNDPAGQMTLHSWLLTPRA